MFIVVLLILAILSPVLFLVPLRFKSSVAIAMVFAGAAVSMWQAISVLVDISTMSIISGSSLFGVEQVAVDSLSALFMIITSVAAITVLIYSRGYLRSYLDKMASTHIALHYVALVLLYISMIFVLVCRSGFWFLFSWEMMTICSFILIAFDASKREVRRAALNYLVFMHIGFVALLVGFVMLSTADLPMNFSSIAAYTVSHNPLVLFILFFVGFGMKAGVFPLHIWLPEAHPAAPSHVSAFMSGVMIKMGVYGVMRVIMYVDHSLYTAGLIVLIVGIVSGLWGVMLAAVQNDIKRLLAYSSIENIGVIFIALGVGIIGRAQDNTLLMLCGVGGALLHTVNHSFFKSLLFLTAGNVYTQTHTTSLNHLGGLARRMPITGVLFLIGMLAICALPPLSGFVSEFLIYYGLLDVLSMGGSGIMMAICAVVALSLIGGVVMLAFTKLYGVVFLGEPRTDAVYHSKEVDGWRIIACALPVAAIVMVGVAPFLIMEVVFDIAGQMFGISDTAIYYGMISADIYKISAAVAVLLLSIVVLVLFRNFKLRGRAVASGPTWGCGFTAGSSKMQYSGESFCEGLQNISTSLTKSIGEGEAVDKSEIFPTEHTFKFDRKDKIDTLFAAWWVELLRRINLRVMKLRTGKVNYYVLYALIFMVLILVLSILNII